MLTITVQVDAPLGAAESAKEVLAMALEAVGITRVVEVRESRAEQVSLWENAPAAPASAAGDPDRASRRAFLETMLGLYSGGALVDPKQEHIYRAELEAMKGGKDRGEEAAAVQQRGRGEAVGNVE